jgi:hypothetical protein
MTVERFRITRTPAGEVEQTWTLLPDRPSAEMQAEELARREKQQRIRVYHEVSGTDPELVLDLNAR